MVASGSAFHPHIGRIIKDLFRLLRVVTLLHGTGALVYSKYPREAAASTCLAIIFGRIARDFSLVPPFNSGPNAPPASVQALPVQCHCQCIIIASAGTDVGHGSLKQPAI